MTAMRRLTLALGFALGLVACSATTESIPGSLTGTWQSERTSLNPSGSYQSTVTFAADGAYRSEIINYGLYNHAASEVSSYTHITGSWAITGDSLGVHTDKLVWWDIFYGAGSPEHEMSYTGTAYDKARFTIDGDRLTLEYLSYPADAPVATTATFVRARP